MSVTFWNMRKRKAKRKAATADNAAAIQPDDMTKKELMAALDAKGVEYPDRSNKEVLLNLLRGVTREV